MPRHAEGRSRSYVLTNALGERRPRQWAELCAQGCRAFAQYVREAASVTLAAQAQVTIGESFDGDAPQ